MEPSGLTIPAYREVPDGGRAGAPGKVRDRLLRGAVALVLALGFLGFAWVTQAGAFVYWFNSEHEAIARGNLDGTEVAQSFIAGVQGEALAVDAKHIYWANPAGNTIGRANLNGTGVDQGFIAGADHPTAVAVDGEHVYWANYGDGKVGRANLNGTGVDQEFIAGANYPSGVAVGGGHIYFANGEWIGRANLDGSGVEPEFILGLYEMRLAVGAGHIYWAQGYTVGRANLDGSGVEPELIAGGPNVGSGVAVDEGHLYWTNGGLIGRANLDGTGIEPEFSTGEGATYGLAVDAGVPEHPSVAIAAESGVTEASVTLAAMVNPNGSNVSACVFEYGPTASYSESVACSPSPGSGVSPVAVSAALSGLSPNTTYHYRVSATNGLGTIHTADATFTTTAVSESSSTLEEAVPTTAEVAALEATASEGIGTVTVGVFETDPAEPPPYSSTDVYNDVALAPGSTFKKLRFKNCELKGAHTVWWANAASEWQPVTPSAYVYTASPGPCITVTITKSTHPSLAELDGTRFGYGNIGPPEFGKCLAAKNALFSEGACGTVAEKGGKVTHKGKFEWFAASATLCYAQKGGNYTESACKTVAEKKGVPTHKGKWEKGAVAYTGTVGQTRIVIAGAPAVECGAGTSEGELTSAKTTTDQIRLTGCKQGNAKCSTAGQAAETIRTEPIEGFIYEEAKSTYSELAASPLLKFSCTDGVEATISGTVSGESAGDANTMSASGETIFKPGVGEQALIAQDAGRTFEAALTLTERTTSSQPQEINTRA